MNKEQMMEAMARLDGFKAGDKITFPQYFYKEDKIYISSDLPDYFTDNEIDRMVRGLDDDELDRYTDNLVQITLCDSKGVIKWTRTLLKATEEQKVEAYLKAKGVWK
jgi:hypothetical protein